MSEQLKKTIGNEQWVRNNQEQILSLFPETWTHISNINLLKIGWNFKLMGIDWRSETELIKCLQFLCAIGFLELANGGYLVRVNPSKTKS